MQVTKTGRMVLAVCVFSIICIITITIRAQIYKCHLHDSASLAEKAKTKIQYKNTKQNYNYSKINQNKYRYMASLLSAAIVAACLERH